MDAEASPAPRRRRAVAVAAGIAFALLSTGFGAFIADPFGAIRAVQQARLRSAGARVETFRGPYGSRLSVYELGPLSAERPVVMLHGLGADATYFTGAALALARRGRTVLLPDAPGSGGSEPPRDERGWGLPARVAALDSLVSALGLTRIDLVGHSLGGWTAGAYAIAFPHRVGRLVLVDPGGFSPVAPDEVGPLRQRLAPTERAGGRVLMDLLFFRKPFPAVGFVVDAFARHYGGPTVRPTVEALTEEDGLLDREARLPAGTAFIWGEREALFPLADGRRAASRVLGGRLFVITGVGHDGPLEAPDVFDEALARALK